MIEWTIVTRKIRDLRDNPKNPRTLTTKQRDNISDCIAKFGFIDKIVINTDNMIIGGHARKQALKKMGIKEIECWFPSRTLTDEEVDELCIKLNKLSGDWDFDLLANNYDTDDLLDWGFTHKDFEILVPELENNEKDGSQNSCDTCEMCGQKIKKGKK